EHDRVAVCRRFERELSSNVPGRAGPVLDDDLLAVQRSQSLCEDAAQEVRDAARRIRHDQPDRLVRIRCGLCAANAGKTQRDSRAQPLDHCLARKSHSALMPAFLTTAAQRVSSSAMSLRNACCDIGAGSSAPDAKRSFTSGIAITRSSAACSLSSTDLGVPPMLAIPYQLITTTSFTPCSPKVGTSGSEE